MLRKVQNKNLYNERHDSKNSQVNFSQLQEFHLIGSQFNFCVSVHIKYDEFIGGMSTHLCKEQNLVVAKQFF